MLERGRSREREGRKLSLASHVPTLDRIRNHGDRLKRLVAPDTAVGPEVISGKLFVEASRVRPGAVGVSGRAQEVLVDVPNR